MRVCFSKTKFCNYNNLIHIPGKTIPQHTSNNTNMKSRKVRLGAKATAANDKHATVQACPNTLRTGIPFDIAERKMQLSTYQMHVK